MIEIVVMDLIGKNRYPLHEPDGAAREKLTSASREQLQAYGSSSLHKSFKAYGRPWPRLPI